MGQAKYLWLDLETTGLDPEIDVILELAAFVTDANLEQLGDPVSMVIGAGYVHMDTVVYEMHTASGLLDEVAESEYRDRDAGDAVLALIGAHEWTDGKPILAGSTVHFDRAFLREWLPGLEERLHHRHLDASGLWMAACDVGHDVPKPSGGHRALADARASLELARTVRGLFR